MISKTKLLTLLIAGIFLSVSLPAINHIGLISAITYDVESFENDVFISYVYLYIDYNESASIMSDRYNIINDDFVMIQKFDNGISKIGLGICEVDDSPTFEPLSSPLLIPDEKYTEPEIYQEVSTNYDTYNVSLIESADMGEMDINFVDSYSGCRYYAGMGKTSYEYAYDLMYSLGGEALNHIDNVSMYAFVSGYDDIANAFFGFKPTEEPNVYNPNAIASSIFPILQTQKSTYSGFLGRLQERVSTTLNKFRTITSNLIFKPSTATNVFSSIIPSKFYSQNVVSGSSQFSLGSFLRTAIFGILSFLLSPLILCLGGYFIIRAIRKSRGKPTLF